MERYDLPDGWEWSTLGEVCSKPQYGYTTKASQKKTGAKFLRITDLKEDGVNWDTVPYCTNPPNNQDAYLLHDDDLVVARAGSVGKSYRVTNPPEAIFASYLIRFRPIKALSSYLGYFLQSPHYWRQIEDTSTGTTMFNVNATKLSALDVPIAPPDEQPRIVAKIENLLEQSRTARAATARIPALMSQFRRAVLASAFRGELVEPDPNDEPAASLLERIREVREQSGYKTSIEPAGTLDFPELPEGWVWAKVEEIAEVRLGRQRSPSRATGPNMRPYLRAANVTWKGLNLSDVKEMDFTPAEQEIYRLRVGDLVLSEASGSISEVGKPAIWNGEIENCCIQNTLIRVRSEGPLPEYLYYHFLFDALTARFSNVAQGIGINHLGAKGLSNWVISIPPLQAQQRIVAKIKVMLAQADIIEQAASVSLRRAEQVDQSILARAFRGELG